MPCFPFRLSVGGFWCRVRVDVLRIANTPSRTYEYSKLATGPTHNGACEVMAYPANVLSDVSGPLVRRLLTVNSWNVNLQTAKTYSQHTETTKTLLASIREYSLHRAVSSGLPAGTKVKPGGARRSKED